MLTIFALFCAPYWFPRFDSLIFSSCFELEKLTLEKIDDEKDGTEKESNESIFFNLFKKSNTDKMNNDAENGVISNPIEKPNTEDRTSQLLDEAVRSY